MMGVVLDIQRFSTHDGPGIRSTVFLKGCSAACSWCHNPESISPKPELEYYPARCIGCGQCAGACPAEAHRFGADRQHAYDRNRCTMCGRCASECFTGALEIAGRERECDEVLGTLLEDAPYYRQSGGGVTLSGGEPVLQRAFALELLRALKSEGIHCAIQTAGHYKYSLIEPLLPYLDLIMYDVKAYSEDIYREHIHADRALIFENLERLSRVGIPIIARTPCVSPVNDNETEITRIARMLSGLPNIEHYCLIPYHSLGKAKYDALDKRFTDFSTPSPQSIARLERLAARYVPVLSGTDTTKGEEDDTRDNPKL